MKSPSPASAAKIVPILRERDGLPTTIELDDGRVLTVFNIAWGIDDGEDFEHLMTNISPEVDGASIDFFLTSEVRSVSAGESSELLWYRD